MTTHVTIIGNMGSDPEMRYTPTGTPVMQVNVAVVTRKNVNGEWQDDNTTWYRVIAWRYLAEHVAESLIRGTRIIVTGTLTNREWETKEGEKRYSLEINAEAIGPDLTFANVSVRKATRETAPLPSDPWADTGNESDESDGNVPGNDSDIPNETAGQNVT